MHMQPPTPIDNKHPGSEILNVSFEVKKAPTNDGAKTMSRLIAVIAAANLFSNSVFPMALAAWTICLNTSTSSRNARIKLPS